MERESNFEDDIALSKIFQILWDKKLILISFLFVSLISGILYAFSLPNIYKSEALISPAQNENTFNRNFQNYSSLASLAGVDISTSNNINPSAEAIEKIQSLSFFSEEILPNISLENLMAEPSWNKEKNSLIYNSNIFNIDTGQWLRNGTKGNGNKPSIQESFYKFSDLISVEENKSSGFITISIEHQSPHIAKKWIELVFNRINISMRLDKKIIAEKSVDYLNLQMTKTNFAETKQVLSELIQNQLQQLAVIEANENYIFKYIAPPYAPEKTYKPDRINLILLASLFGLILGAIAIVFLHLRNKFYN